MRLLWLAVVACVPAVLGGQSGTRPPRELPALGTAGLARSLEAARLFDEHIWRDTPPVAGDQVAAYVEIPRGDRRKWEFDMRANARAIDRIIPGDLGGYPINYGFVPQTISWCWDSALQSVGSPASSTASSPGPIWAPATSRPRWATSSWPGWRSVCPELGSGPSIDTRWE